MEKSLCHLLVEINHASVANFLRHKYVLYVIRENEILAKINDFIVLWLRILNMAPVLWSGFFSVF